MTDQHSPNDIVVKSPEVAASAKYADDLPTTGRQKAWLVFLVIMKRVRFILILMSIGMFIVYWETVKNYWDKFTRPSAIAAKRLSSGQEFFCPMDPQVIRASYEQNGDVPKCPICGMPLSVRQKGKAPVLPEGIASRVQFSPERVQMAGIKTVSVTYRPMVKQTVTVGYVTFDETRLSRVVSRVSGYIERLYVDNTYAAVNEGEPLAEIYSPDLFSAAQELVIASKQTNLSDLTQTVSTKLRLLGVSEPEIDAIRKAGVASPRLVIRSPRSGYVIDKKIVAGASVEAGMTLLDVADLSQVWIEADVFEKDVVFLQQGQAVTARLEAFPNREFAGSISLIYPELNAATRTNRVRFSLANPARELRPGMFAEVAIETPLDAIGPFNRMAETGVANVLASAGKDTGHKQGEFLAVPERAVVDSGKKRIVYVARENGVFEGVEVELGPRNDDYYPVLRGLRAGDQVAAAGGFLIDAETRLNPAAASTFFGASGGPQASEERPTNAAPDSSNKGSTPDRHANRDNTALVTPSPEDLKNIASLPEEDRRLALAQQDCPITLEALGSMGAPLKIMLSGQPVFVCCKGCIGKAKRAPQETLATVAKLKSAVASQSSKGAKSPH